MTPLRHVLFLFALLLISSCKAQTGKTSTRAASARLQTGAEQMNQFLPLLKGKRVGMVVNHTSIVGNTHLVDSLLARGIAIKTIFAPEHGFRGQATDGETIADGRDTRTGVPIISLYGKNRKPAPEQIDSLDVLIFDIQDVGTRFYTYISTMHYVMEACAEQKKPLIVLDRPNPNGNYVDGPVLDPKFQSFVGMHPIPVVHGLTVGELAQMINGEKWLKNGVTCPLTVVKIPAYNHRLPYRLPVPPSPNLPNQQSVLLYPSLCFFEGTIVSVGRGTDKQFQVIGAPENPAYGKFEFTPTDKPGAVNPPQEGKRCYGYDLSQAEPPTNGLSLKYLFEFFRKTPDKTKFFLATNYIDKLAGTDEFRKQVLAGKSEAEIRKTWEPGLNRYRALRKKYLLYP
ncbi:exo-beta-N-acetylmuramidase NamZ family protein [Tellurirhabdus rosea]|uniref:exo-beta-N-acetylmuramidase NamZ family protein n=1 Tax=Tellurirhabdus rosea TaxID=2674997 RepID=UPI002252B2FF|nr:DUF1343 domain-containing protein [Tellurirhabdus rosea]